ncbi:MAG: hypothetical protein M3083_02800 [Actinomycetota bacterium]|nr:hypothetical protein [Actinomycetota bacterium]
MNRNDLERQFHDLSPQGSWKTLVLEGHPGSKPVDSFLAEVFGGEAVQETDDVHIHQVETGSVRFTVDSLDDRFWSFHTNGLVGEARAILRAAVNRRRDLDFVWLPSAHLQAIERLGQTRWIKTEFRGQEYLSGDDDVNDLSVMVRGRRAQALLDLIATQPDHTYTVCLNQLGVLAADDHLGTVDEAVTRQGTFLAKGDSFPLHQEIISGAVRRYRRLVEMAERFAIGFDPIGDPDDPSGGQMEGGPIEFSFSRPLPDFDMFLSHLLSAREPFRLWGVPEKITSDFAEVEAVDLHIGERLRLEMSSKMLRVILRRGSCGNSVVRLVSNLQRHVDGALAAVDPAFQAEICAEDRLVGV